MPSPQEYVQLSQRVYDGPEAGAPDGWEVLTDSQTAGIGSENGYLGVAYRKVDTGEIVVANRGSRGNLDGLKQDWAGSDVKIAAQGSFGVPAAFEDAKTFADVVQLENPGAPISYTGHSLGGAEAQVQAAVTGGEAVTFGAPGAKFAVSDEEAELASNNVVNYTLPEPVAHRGEHVGKTVALTPAAAGVAKDALLVTAATAVAGFVGGLIAGLVALLTNHKLGNYAAALGGGGGGGGGAGKPAARISDMHVCPLVTGVVPHVGGPVSIGCPTVLIGNMPAARIGDMVTCVGPPDTIAMGSATVLIGGKPAARLGDMTGHGGQIVVGMPTVLTGG